MVAVLFGGKLHGAPFDPGLDNSRRMRIKLATLYLYEDVVVSVKLDIAKELSGSRALGRKFRVKLATTVRSCEMNR